MPVRVVCPACATQLNIRDEHAGRAVKCPKCNYVIPPAQAAPPVAPPGADLPPTPGVSAAPENYGPAPYSRPPEPPPLPSMPPPVPTPPSYRSAVPRPMDLDDDERSLPPRPTAKPTSRRNDDEDDDDDRLRRPSARPTGRKRDDDDDDRPGRPAARRKRDDDDDDRPTRRPPRPRDGGDDDDDGSIGRRPPKAKSNTPLILLIVGGLLLTCCGGVGYGIYYFVIKVKEAAQDAREWVENLADRTKYDSIKINMTRQEVEARMGAGSLATADDISKTFSPNSSAAKDWAAKANAGRVFIWHFGKDTALACFHPDAKGNLQAKVWETPDHNNTAQDGWIDDEQYLKLRSTRPVPGTPEPPATPITAQELAKAYKGNAAEADKKYKDKWLLVEGKVNDINQLALETPLALDALPPDPGKVLGTMINCLVPNADARDAWRLSRGQKVKIRGKCLGYSDPYVTLTQCKIESPDADPSVQAQAGPFFAEFAKDNKAADTNYKDKQITLLSFRVESKEDTFLILAGPAKSKETIKVKATWPFDSRKQLNDVKVGQRVTVKGEYSSFSDGTIYVNRCWLVP